MIYEEPCPYCGSLSGQVFVHGHYQCVQCGQNVMPCCDGAPAGQGHFGSGNQAGKQSHNAHQNQNPDPWNKSW